MAERSSKLVGAAGVVMALCCLAGPGVLGAAAGAAIGDLLGIVAAVAVAAVAAVLLWRARAARAC
jgi:hypothetical protein